MTLEKNCVSYSALNFTSLKKSQLDLVIFPCPIKDFVDFQPKNESKPWFFLQSMNFNTL